MTRVVVGPVSSLPPGTQTSVDVNGRAVAVFNVGGRFFALRNSCPHQGAPLSTGIVVSELTATGPGQYCFDGDRRHVRCPWHGWEYDLETGQSWFDPKRNRVKSFNVSVEHGEALLAGERQPGPYVAETFVITVEDDYVVIEA